MKKKSRVLIIVGSLLLLFVVICLFGIYKYGPLFGIYLTPPTPAQYGEIALKIMDNGIYSDTEEWNKARKAAEEEFGLAASYEDTYKTLSELAKLAGGKHSFFNAPEKTDTTSTDSAVEKDEILFPEVKEQDDILIIKLPEFSKNPQEAKNYSEIVLKALGENRTPKGVILDLRGNRGGDMNPMITAVAPLLPDGVILSFGMRMTKVDITLDGLHISSSDIRVEMTPFKVPQITPIAILTDNQTASSGEATLICFRGLPNVKVFGTPTAGFASGNTPFNLYDGATLVLTMGTDIARTGEVFCEDPIAPDVETQTPLEDAFKWINE